MFQTTNKAQKLASRVQDWLVLCLSPYLERFSALILGGQEKLNIEAGYQQTPNLAQLPAT